MIKLDCLKRNVRHENKMFENTAYILFTSWGMGLW